MADLLKFERRHKGKRYWACLLQGPGKFRFVFYSSHKWPFYHGHFDQTTLDREEAYAVFLDWLPFKT